MNILMFMSSDLRSYLVSWLIYRCFKTPPLLKLENIGNLAFVGVRYE